VKYTFTEFVVPSTRDILLIIGAEPTVFVVTEDEAVELPDVQAVPDTALKMKVYDVPAVNPVITAGLVVPDTSWKLFPLLVEY
jgi:hypothetical protein